MGKYKLEYNDTWVTLASKPFAGGGEGNLYVITSPSKFRHYVAKLYHPHKLSAVREQKIGYLAQFPPINSAENEDAHPSVVWVKDALYLNGKFVGFIMPYTSGEKLEILCTPKIPRKLRRDWNRFDFKSSPNALEMRMKLCFNICAAIHQVHATERYVLVDMKPDNIVIQPNGLVSIVDTDSVEVIENGKSIFDAPVATPEYTPPEFYQELNYDPTTKDEWDRFGLGVIMYKLLFGIHPFAASSGAPYEHLVSLHDKIKHGLFVHHPAKQNTFIVVPPPHKQFYKLDKSLQDLFMRCFIDGHHNPALRPSAEEWCAAILLAIDDEAAYKRYGHILGGNLMTSRPRFSLPSSRIELPHFTEAAFKLVELSKEPDTPKPRVNQPAPNQLKSFQVNKLSTGELIGTLVALFAFIPMGLPFLSVIVGIFLGRKAYDNYQDERLYKQKEQLKESLNKTRLHHKSKLRGVNAAKRSFRRSVRWIVPKIEKVTEQLKKEVEELKLYLLKQDERVRELEQKAVEQYQALNQKYVKEASDNRIVARYKDADYDSLAKIKIAINNSHKKAVDVLTKDQPISMQHPVMKDGKMEVDALVNDKKMEISNLIGEKTTELQEKQEAELKELFAGIAADADVVRNMDRLWTGRKALSEDAKEKVLGVLKNLGFHSITQINNINARTGWVTLKDGKRFSVKEFKHHRMVLKNLRLWFDEIKHLTTSYNKAKAKIRQSYRMKIKELDEEKRIELKGLEQLQKKEMAKVKVAVQKVVLGAPFSNLQTEYETVTEYVEELEQEYLKEEAFILKDYNQLYDSIIQDCEAMVVQTEKKIDALEASLEKYNNKINSRKVQKRYKVLEEELSELKRLLPQLEQKEFEYKQFDKINFVNYLKQLAGQKP